MKKLIKITAVLAVLFVVLLVAAFVTLKIMFPAGKLKTLAQSYAQKTLQREITFSSVSFNLVGITLNDVAISESHTFEQGTFLKADQAVFKMALGPLLRKRIEITTVGLKGLQVNAIRREDGTFNWEDLLASQPENTDQTPDKKEESSSSFFSLRAKHIYAKDCHLHYQDIPGKMNFTLSPFNLDIQDFDLAAPFNAKLQFTATYKDAQQEISLPVKSTLTFYLADLHHEQAYATLQNLTTTYKDISIGLKGGLKNFNQPVLNLQGTISGVSNAALADLAPDLPHFVLPDISFNADAEADLEHSSARLTQAKLSVADSFITATGQTGWGETASTYTVKTDLNLNLTQLAAMTKLLDGFEMDGQITGQLTATDKKNGQDISGTIALSGVGLKYPPVTLSEMDAHIKMVSPADISSQDITGKLNNEPFTASVAYKDLGKILDLVLNANFSKLIIENFSSDTDTTAAAAEPSAQQAAATAQTTEKETLFNLKANIKIGDIKVPYFASKGATLSAQLQKASASMKSANGTVSFELQEGSINDLFSFVGESKIIKILLLPLALVNKVTSTLGVDLFPAKSPEDKGKIKVSDASAAYVFTNGIMELQETHLNSALSNLTATGNVNFQTEKLDMRVKASVLTSQTPIVIKIGGTISNPSGKLDLAQTAVSLVTGIVNYKTPGKVAVSTVETAANATKSVANTGVDAVKNTVNTAASTVKTIGNLFKHNKSSDEEKEK